MNGTLETDTISSSWGRQFLIAIAITVILSILLTILLSIAEAIRTRDEDLITEDERSKLIERTGEQISSNIVGAGMVLAMIFLAMGRSPLLMLNTIIYSFFIGGIFSLCVQLYRYRRGF